MEPVKEPADPSVLVSPCVNCPTLASTCATLRRANEDYDVVSADLKAAMRELELTSAALALAKTELDSIRDRLGWPKDRLGYVTRELASARENMRLKEELRDLRRATQKDRGTLT